MWFIETLSQRIFWLQTLTQCISNCVISDGPLIQLTKEGLPFAERLTMLHLNLSTKSHTMKRLISGLLESYASSYWLGRHHSQGKMRMIPTLTSRTLTCRRQTIPCVHLTPWATMPSISASKFSWQIRTSVWVCNKCGDTHGSTKHTRQISHLVRVWPRQSALRISPSSLAR